MRGDPKIEIDVMWERKEYTSDLTDAEWAIIEPLLPEDKAVGRLREVDLREVFNAINDRADNGAKWRNLPGELAAWQTVYSYFRSWVRLGIWESINAALVTCVRESVGRESEPSLTVIDSQSLKLGQKGGPKLGLMGTKRSKAANVILR